MRQNSITIYGRPLVYGACEGYTLVSDEPISFYGGVDPSTGRIVEKGHPLKGQKISGKILIFPYGKGSTVGSYILLRLKRKGLAPSGIINLESEPIIIVGCIISQIPLMDRPGIELKDIPNNRLIKMVVSRDKAFITWKDGWRWKRK